MISALDVISLGRGDRFFHALGFIWTGELFCRAKTSILRGLSVNGT
jgi:hypothetical protein